MNIFFYADNHNVYGNHYQNMNITNKRKHTETSIEEINESYSKKQKSESLPSRAYIYCRTSKSNKMGVSLGYQEEVCRQYAKKNNISIVACICDDGISARNMKQQEGLLKIINDIKKGEYILFYKISRFSRSTDQALDVLEKLRNDIGAIAHSVYDNIAWDNMTTNRDKFTQILEKAHDFSVQLSEDMKNIKQYQRDRGYYIGNPPYGYNTQYIDGVRKLVINPDELLIIKEMFTEESKIINTNFSSVSNREKDFSLCKSITEKINEKYKNRRNKPFTVNNVKRIMLKWKESNFIKN